MWRVFAGVSHPLLLILLLPQMRVVLQKVYGASVAVLCRPIAYLLVLTLIVLLSDERDAAVLAKVVMTLCSEKRRPIEQEMIP